MKKILSCLFVLCAFSVNCAFSVTFTVQNVQSSYQVNIQKNISNDKYLKFYNVDSKNIQAGFNFLSNNSEKKLLKTLSKDDKKNYKKAKKIQKLIAHERWNEVFYKYSDFFPAYIQYYDYLHKNKDHEKALPVLVRINEYNAKYQVLEQDAIDYNLAVLYFYNGKYSQALNYLKKFEPTTDVSINSAIADCYCYTGNYNASITYINKLGNLDYHNKETLFEDYYALHNNAKAYTYAKELLKENYNYTNLIRVADTTSNETEILNYAHKARTMTSAPEDIEYTNDLIATVEQKKLDRKVSNLTQFVRVPNWKQIRKQIPENIEPAELSAKQDEFFKNANLYLEKYKGQQLTNAFNSLNQDFNNYIQDKKNEYYRQQQLDAQKALIIEQQRSNMLQRQMIYEQQVQNSLERQRLYYYYTPYYHHHAYW